MIRKVFALAVHDLRLLLTERGAAITRLLMPIAFIFVVGIANDAFAPEDVPAPVLAIVDEDESELSAFFASHVAERLGSIEVVRASERVTDAVESGRVASVLEGSALEYAVVIPAGFGESLLRGSPVGVELVFAQSDPREASRIEPILRAAGTRATLVAAAGDAARGIAADPSVADEAADAAVVRALDLFRVDRTAIIRTQIELPETYPLDGFRQSVPGMGSMFVMMSVLAGAALLVEERRRWTLQRTLIAPISPVGFVTGKVMGRFMIGMAQYLVAIATGVVLGFLFGISFGSSPLLVLAVMSAFVFAVSGVSVLLATLVTREQHAGGLNTLLAVTLAPLGGAWWSLDMEVVPDVMRRIAVVSPFYWVIEGFRAAIYDLGFAAASVPLAVLTGLGVVAAVIAAVRLRAE